MTVASATKPVHSDAGLLGDTAARDYASKLRLFNRFAEPEIRSAIDALELRTGMCVLDAGCGTGEASSWLREAVGPEGLVVGCDLAEAHARAARSHLPGTVVQSDLSRAAFKASSFDVIWCMNTANHFRDRAAVLRDLARLLRPGGRLVLLQSSLLPDMYFAWDGRLEREVMAAVRRHYQQRYQVSDRDLTNVRSLLGTLRALHPDAVAVKTLAIDRIAPLDAASRDYLQQVIFDGTWGARVRPHLAAEDFSMLTRLCDPADELHALKRPDFHFVQTLTIATARFDRS